MIRKGTVAIVTNNDDGKRYLGFIDIPVMCLLYEGGLVKMHHSDFKTIVSLTTVYLTKGQVWRQV